MVNLIIVESPTKAHKIQKILGSKYKVIASMGHIMDLPPTKLSIDENTFEVNYEFLERNMKNIENIKSNAKKASKIIIASDPDREGEFIAYSITQLLNIKKPRRMTYNEITEEAINSALKNIRSLDNSLISAQKARRVIDRLVGYKIQPYLNFQQSAGRVQSVLVRLIIEKEKEIEKTPYNNFYVIKGNFVVNKQELTATLLSDNKNAHVEHKDIKKLIKLLQTHTYIIKNIKVSKETKSPSPPFTTSSLQQEANNKYGFSSKQTMSTAQKLYEQGYITYHRTDSTNLSNNFLEQINKYIVKTYGENYANKYNYVSKVKNSQEAHEAIRPTKLTTMPNFKDKTQEKLYNLILQRTLSSQMSKTTLEATKIYIPLNNEYYFEIINRKILFDGYLKLYNNMHMDDNITKNDLSKLKINDILNYTSINAEEKYLKNMAHYTEAQLIKQMEDKGIGRPSTYANMIEKIQLRNYVIKKDIEGENKEITNYIITPKKIKENKENKQIGAEQNKFVSTNLGNIINSYLIKNFPTIMDYEFTNEMEEGLDKISNGELSYKNYVEKFYKTFMKSFKNLEKLSSKDSKVITKWKDYDVKLELKHYGQVVSLYKNDELIKMAPFKGSSPKDLTDKFLKELFKYPKKIGTYKEIPIMLNKGKFGLYLSLDKNKYSLPYVNKQQDENITENEAVKLIKKKDKQHINTVDKYKIMEGDYGYYIKYKNKFKNVNIKIPEEYHDKLMKLTVDDIDKIIKYNYENKYNKFKKKK